MGYTQADMDAMHALLPPTFYPDLPLPARIRRLVEEVAGLREALRRVPWADVAKWLRLHEGEIGPWDAEHPPIMAQIADDFDAIAAALRDRAGVPPPQDRAGLGEVAASAEGKTESVDAYPVPPNYYLQQLQHDLIVAEAERDELRVQLAARPAPVPLARAPLEIEESACDELGCDYDIVNGRCRDCGSHAPPASPASRSSGPTDPDRAAAGDLAASPETTERGEA